MATLLSLFLLIASAETAYGSGQRPWNLSPLIRIGEPSYGSLGYACIGKAGAFFSDLILAISCFGFAVSCLVEVGDCMAELMKEILGPKSLQIWYLDPFYDRDFWIFVFYIALIPLCLVRTTDNMNWFNAASAICAVYLIVMVIYLSASTTTAPSTPQVVEPKASSSWTQTIPIFIFAFACHQNVTFQSLFQSDTCS
jgi:amino acid permease